MSITQKILVSIILIVLIVVTIMPTVQAVAEEVLSNGTQEEILYQQEENNINSEKTSNIPTNFEVLLACVLNHDEGASGNEFELSEVPSIILQKPTKNGVWIEEESREYVLNLINSLTNKIYKVDTDGYLIEDLNLTKEESDIMENYNFYTEKIDEMISQDKLTIISINDTYKQLNEIDNDIIDMRIEDDEYGLLFKDKEEKERNKENIIILNSKNYTLLNTVDTSEYLLDKFLESYYYDDEEFLDYINSKNNKNDNINNQKNIDENITNAMDSNVIKGNMANEISKEEVSSETIEHLKQKNIFDDEVSEADFNLTLAGILSDNVNANNINEVLQSKPIKAGIWVSESSRNSFLSFLNEHTIYTYSVDNEGYLICDNIMKENPNLDILEKSETEFDMEYKKLLSENKMIIIDITNEFLQYDEENNIIFENLTNDEYKKTFSNNGKRIIILNSIYYSDAGYDLALSDHLVKALENVQEKVLTGELTFNKQPLTRSDTSKPGNMLSGQNVYAGPDASNYFKVGSVDAGEQVYLLGQQAGWYHIQYMVTGTSQQKSGFVPVSTVNNNGYSVSEEQMTGGQRYPKQGLEVMSVDDSGIYVKVGSVFQGEGVTQLYDYTFVGVNKLYRISYIEFSTASGTKRGYVYTDQLENASYATSVARVIDTNSAYAGPDNSFVKLGGAYRNEFVTILAKNTGNDWVFVEYNTPSGRKRGYMSYSKLYNYNHPGMYNDLATNQGLRQATQQLTVYGGPNNNNANIGAVFNQEVVSLYGVERGYAYVEYSTTNGAKRGYVIESALTGATPPSIPNIPTYANFTSGSYGTSGLGQSLKYYKIGNGPNVAFAVFAQHGWEDAWAYDGIELVNIANRVMSNLSSSGINNNWTLYVIPYANPDGITNGYTNNGPGRCTVTTSIDMNRCWPANFTPYYTSRNYTGDSSLGAPEAVALRAFIQNNMGSNEKIILDIHGWLNQTYGNVEIGQYFGDQFGFGHSSTYGSGYLETWGKSIGAKSCLVELPMPSSSSDIINRDFSGKLTNAVRNMLGGTNQGSGTEVYEQVTVTASGSLNVRSGPGTSYPIVATVTGGTTVTRIRKAVANANGYTWDKIRLSNGTEGYVATNYLTILNEGNTLSNNDVKIVKTYCKFNKINNYTGDTNSSEYDYSIYLTIKEFQRINELTQTGYVNTATWNAMELNQSSIYSLYQTINSNYNNYGNAYGPSPYAVPDSSYGTKFLIDETKTTLQQEEQWSTEESRYDTMNATDRITKAGNMAATETTLKAIAAGSVTLYPHASEGITHYLGKTGTLHPLTSQEVSQFLNGSQGRRNLRDSYTQHAKNAVEYMLTIDKVADFSMEQGMSLELSVSDLDWFAFLGHYYFYINGNCYKRGDTYSIAGNYVIRDYYDFDSVEGLAEIIKNIQQGNFDDIAESRVGDLHYAGKAKFYYIEGSTSFIEQWTK